MDLVSSLPESIYREGKEGLIMITGHNIKGYKAHPVIRRLDPGSWPGCLHPHGDGGRGTKG